MSQPAPRSRLGRVCDKYEKLVNRGTLFWLPVDKGTLDPATAMFLEKILEPTGIRYYIADVRLAGTVLFRLEDPKVRFLHHDPASASHMYADEGFHNGLNANDVLIYFGQLAKHIKTPDEVRSARAVCEFFDVVGGEDPTEGKRLES